MPVRSIKGSKKVDSTNEAGFVTVRRTPTRISATRLTETVSVRSAVRTVSVINNGTVTIGEAQGTGYNPIGW